FVRLAHYPQHPAVLDACDRLGLIVWEEIPLTTRVPITGNLSHYMMREMVRQHHAHPSIAFWGLANEPTFVQAPDPQADPDTQIVALIEDLNQLAHQEDPSRLTALAISRDELERGGVGEQLSDITDVLGLN